MIWPARQQPPPPGFHRDLAAVLATSDPAAADAAMRQHVRWGIEETVRTIRGIRPQSSRQWRLRAGDMGVRDDSNSPVPAAVQLPTTGGGRSGVDRRRTMTRDHLRTPALMVDLDRMEANLERMAAFFRTVSGETPPPFQEPQVPGPGRAATGCGRHRHHLRHPRRSRVPGASRRAQCLAGERNRGSGQDPPVCRTGSPGGRNRLRRQREDRGRSGPRGPRPRDAGQRAGGRRCRPASLRRAARRARRAAWPAKRWKKACDSAA